MQANPVVNPTGQVPIGGLQAFDGQQTGNLVTGADGSVFLKTGVTASGSSYPLATSKFGGTATNFNHALSSYTFPSGNNVRLVYFNNLWIACVNYSSGLYVYSSPDLNVWTQRSNSLNVGYNGYTTFRVLNNRLVIAQMSGTSNGAINWSADGITWSSSNAVTPTGSTGIGGIAYGNGLYVAVNGANSSTIWTSPDLVTWTTRTGSRSTNPNPYYGNCIAFAKNANGGTGLFVLISNAPGSTYTAVSTSVDGITWTNRTTTAPSYAFTDICASDSIFVISQNDASYSTISSTDGITWTNGSTADLNTNQGAVYFNGAFNRYNRYSTNGTTWQTGYGLWQYQDTASYYFSIGYVSGIAFLAYLTTGGVTNVGKLDSNGLFNTTNNRYVTNNFDYTGTSSTQAIQYVAFANYWQQINMNTATNLYSYDGIFWGQGGLPVYSSAFVFSGRYNSTTPVVIQNGYIYYPSGGTLVSSWTAQTYTAGSYTGAMRCTNNIFFSFVSTGSTISGYISVGTGALGSVTFADIYQANLTMSGAYVDCEFKYVNGQYIMYYTTGSTGNYITVYRTSSNGTTWSLPASPTISVGGIWASKMVQVGNFYFVTEYNGGTAGTKLYRSTDGINWTLLTNGYGAASSITYLTTDGTILCGFSGNSNITIYNPSTDGNNYYVRNLTTTPVGYAVDLMYTLYNNIIPATGNGNTQNSIIQISATPTVLNDINLKTYNATSSLQTDFYKRVV
jgi:hypothetical protein